VKSSRRPCGVCSLDGRFHHRGPSGRVEWCSTVQRTWPTAALIARCGDRVKMCNALGISPKGGLQDELSDAVADRWAIRCGYHPEQVWPGWTEAGLRYVDRVFLESGWRQAWLQWERTTNTAVEATA